MEKIFNYIEKKGKFRTIGTFSAIIAQICFIIGLLQGGNIIKVSIGLIGVIMLIILSLQD